MHGGSHIFSHILNEKKPEESESENSEDNPVHVSSGNTEDPYLPDEIAGTSSGLEGIWGSAITTNSILGYDVTWWCSGSDGRDRELTLHASIALSLGLGLGIGCALVQRKHVECKLSIM